MTKALWRRKSINFCSSPSFGCSSLIPYYRMTFGLEIWIKSGTQKGASSFPMSSTKCMNITFSPYLVHSLQWIISHFIKSNKMFCCEQCWMMIPFPWCWNHSYILALWIIVHSRHAIIIPFLPRSSLYTLGVIMKLSFVIPPPKGIEETEEIKSIMNIVLKNILIPLSMGTHP